MVRERLGDEKVEGVKGREMMDKVLHLRDIYFDLKSDFFEDITGDFGEPFIREKEEVIEAIITSLRTQFLTNEALLSPEFLQMAHNSDL